MRAQQIYSVSFLCLNIIHILALSPQLTAYSASAEHIQLWNQDSLSYGGGGGVWSQGCVDYIVCPFLEHNYGVVVWGFRSSSVPVAHESHLVESRRPLWFGSSQADRCL